MIHNEHCKVISQIEIAESIYELVLEGSIVVSMKSPGQFVHLKVAEASEPLLRRPISISSIDQESKTFKMIYRKEGRGTALLSGKKPGDTVDVLGPLGNGFSVHETDKGQKALLVGGGIGVPPLYELTKQLTAAGVQVTHVLGFQTGSAAFYQQEFTEFGETHIATVDGTAGYKGYVTDVIDHFHLDFDVLYACGPTPMLKALQNKFSDKKVFLSLEERMGCGIGACFACVCHTSDDPTGYSYKKVCTDGPVFRAGEVVL